MAWPLCWLWGGSQERGHLGSTAPGTCKGQSPRLQSLVLCRALLPTGPLTSELCAFSVTASETLLSQSWDLWTCHLTGGVMMDSQGDQGPHKQKTFCPGGWRGAGDLRLEEAAAGRL